MKGSAGWRRKYVSQRSVSKFGLVFSVFLLVFAGAATSAHSTLITRDITGWTQGGASGPYFTQQRGGNNSATGGDWEVGTGVNTNAPTQIAQASWSNGSSSPFTIHYNSSNQMITLTGGVQQSTVSYAFSDAFTGDYYLTLSGRPSTGNVASAEATNLVFNSVPITAVPMLAVGNSKAFHIGNWDPATDHTLTGDLKFTWTGSFPQGSRLQLIARPRDTPVNVALDLTGGIPVFVNPSQYGSLVGTQVSASGTTMSVGKLEYFTGIVPGANSIYMAVDLQAGMRVALDNAIVNTISLGGTVDDVMALSLDQGSGLVFLTHGVDWDYTYNGNTLLVYMLADNFVFGTDKYYEYKLDFLNYAATFGTSLTGTIISSVSGGQNILPSAVPEIPQGSVLFLGLLLGVGACILRTPFRKG